MARPRTGHLVKRASGYFAQVSTCHGREWVNLNTNDEGQARERLRDMVAGGARQNALAFVIGMYGVGRVKSGYVIVRVDGRDVPQHRLVMERMLGRRLSAGENVHHINGDRADNRPCNLELWSTSQPSGQRVHDKVAWAKSILRSYDKGAA